MFLNSLPWLEELHPTSHLAERCDLDIWRLFSMGQFPKSASSERTKLNSISAKVNSSWDIRH